MTLFATYGGAAGASAAGAHAAAIANATKASGAIVKINHTDFQMILGKMDSPLVVMAENHFLSTSHKYLTNYKGIFFYTKSSTPLELPSKAELITANKIWIPG